MRIAILFDSNGPYHRARLLAANRRMEVIGVEARKRSFMYDWKPSSVRDDLRIIQLTESEERSSLAWRAIMDALDQRLLALRVETVAIPGWSDLTSLATLAWAVRHGIPAIVMSESNEFDFSRWRPLELVKRYLVGSFTAGLAGADSQKRYLSQLGLNTDAIFLGCDAVDNAYFANGVYWVRRAKIMPRDCRLGREDFGRFFLTIARMVEKKNLIRLVEAYSRYVASESARQTWPLVILGDGPIRQLIERHIVLRNLLDAVVLPGFRQYEELPSWYGAAGCFVLASIRDQWGLVVNEAMASELPVLVSSSCGCARTLVHEGVNGWTFDPFDIDGMAKNMARIAGAEENERAAMGDASKSIVADWGVERFAEGLEAAARFAIKTGSRRAGLAKRAALGAIALIQERRGVAGAE